MRATIKDIAKAAGVSPTTVSFVLNNKPVSIKKETREKVYQAAKELNYSPNQLAISMVTQRTNTIGLVIPDSTNLLFAELLDHINNELRNHNITVSVGSSDWDPHITRKYLRMFSDRRVDGIILIEMDFEDPDEIAKCIELICSLDMPVVFVNQITDDESINTVTIDQEMIGYIATKHLLNLGHRRIGCASGSIKLKVNAYRYHGHQKALSEYGLVAEPELLFCESVSVECGRKALPNLLGHGVTAVFAFNDMIAYGLYKECHNFGLSIPKDLSVIGVDDTPFSDIIQPPLTTVAHPVRLIASNAVTLVLSLIDDSKAIPEIPELSPLLKVRASTANLLSQPADF